MRKGPSVVLKISFRYLPNEHRTLKKLQLISMTLKQRPINVTQRHDVVLMLLKHCFDTVLLLDIQAKKLQ